MRYVILLLLLAAVPLHALCFDLKGIQLGKRATPDEVLEKLGVQCGIGANEMQVCNGPTTVGQFPASLNLVINAKGIVQRIDLSLEPSAFETIAPLLVQKFGSPASIQRGVIQNRMGAKFEQLVYVWRKPGGLELSYRLYADDLDHSSLYFGTAEDRRLLKDRGTPAKQRRSDL